MAVSQLRVNKFNEFLKTPFFVCEVKDILNQEKAEGIFFFNQRGLSITA